MIKFGTIGSNWITESFINDALATGKWELGGIYSRDIRRSKALGEKFGCDDCFDSLEGLAGCGIEAVYIASPNSFHFQQILYFIERGMHVVCEKPMVVNREQFAKAVDLAAKKNVFLLEALRHINSPVFPILKELTGSIGPIRNVIFSYNQYSSRYESFKRGELPNVFNPDFYGGALMDLGVYPVSLAVALWGRPIEFKSMSVRLENGVDATGTVLLRYDGFLCNITYSKIADGFIENEIAGEMGCLILDKPAELSRITLQTKLNPPRDIELPTQTNKLQGEAEVFAAIINNRDYEKYKKLTEISCITNELLDSLGR